MDKSTQASLPEPSQLPESPRAPEQDEDSCPRCGQNQTHKGDLCETCVESINEEDELEAPGEDWEVEHSSDEPQDDPVINDGNITIRGEARTPRRTWAAKEPYIHGTTKRLLHQDARKFLDLEAEEDDGMEDDDTPQLLEYLDQWPKLTPITKISMLRAAANYLSSQQRAAKPFQVPVRPPKRISAKMTATAQKKRTRFDSSKK